MRNIWTIAKRELRQYFNSPIAYAVMFLVMLVQGLIFYVNYYFSTLQQYVPDIRMVLSPMVKFSYLLLQPLPCVCWQMNRKLAHWKY
jgi:ABC-type transport system involved in multi-copper enzyme maturation permease subunit